MSIFLVNIRGIFIIIKFTKQDRLPQAILRTPGLFKHREEGTGVREKRVSTRPNIQ